MPELHPFIHQDSKCLIRLAHPKCLCGNLCTCASDTAEPAQASTIQQCQ
jgi:hypothetical protein